MFIVLSKLPVKCAFFGSKNIIFLFYIKKLPVHKKLTNIKKHK